MAESLAIFFFFNDTATTEIYTLSLHDALPTWTSATVIVNGFLSSVVKRCGSMAKALCVVASRSEEHTSELQSRPHLVCRLLLEKKKQLQNPVHKYNPAPKPTP